MADVAPAAAPHSTILAPQPVAATSNHTVVSSPDTPTDVRRALDDAASVVTDTGRALAGAAQQISTDVREVASVTVKTAADMERALISEAQQHVADAQRTVVDTQQALTAQAQRRVEYAHRVATDTERAIRTKTEHRLDETRDAILETERRISDEARRRAAEIEHTVIEAEHEIVAGAQRRVLEAERALAEAKRQLELEAQTRVLDTKRELLEMRTEIENEARARATEVQARVEVQAQRALGEAYKPVAEDTRVIADEVQKRLVGRMLRRDSRSPGNAPAGGAAPPAEERGRKPVASALFSLGGSMLAMGTNRFTRNKPAPGAAGTSTGAVPPTDPYRQIPPMHRGASTYQDVVVDLPTLPSAAAQGVQNRGPSPGIYAGEDEKNSIQLGTHSSVWSEKHGLGRRKPRLITVKERLEPTMESAKDERDRCKIKAAKTGFWVNLAIGLQVLFGALTTGLSAALSGKKAGVTTSIFGGITTMLASYLARMRGSGEPELSRARTKELDNFIRDIKSFILDRGDQVTQPYLDEHGNPDPKRRDDIDLLIEGFRKRFEDIMGNGNQERKLISPV